MKLTFIADPHYYSKTLGTEGKAYELRSGSDQKCLAETAEILDSAFHTIAGSDTDAVLILGDLTNDGERVCHAEFREKLYELKKHKPVYVITATHDWCSDENPRRFVGDQTFHDVPVMTSQELPAFYHDFGPSEAIDSFITEIGTICYTVQIGVDLRVLCLNDDKNGEGHAGFTKDCRKWIEKQIARAKEDNVLLIGIMHHLLMPHASRLLTGGSVCIAHREEVCSWLADCGLRYMFVGHSHIQATDRLITEQGNTITEVNVGSLCGYPAPMVRVTVGEDHSLSYEVTYLKSFTYHGKKIDAQRYLAHHTCQLIDRVIFCRNADLFADRLNALKLKVRHPEWTYYCTKPLLRWIGKARIVSAFHILKWLGFAENLTREEIEPISQKKLIELVHEIWMNLFDGQRKTYAKDDPYYKLVMAAFSALSRMMRNNADARELIRLGEYLLTGGEINNQRARI